MENNSNKNTKLTIGKKDTFSLKTNSPKNFKKKSLIRLSKIKYE